MTTTEQPQTTTTMDQKTADGGLPTTEKPQATKELSTAALITEETKTAGSNTSAESKETSEMISGNLTISGNYSFLLANESSENETIIGSTAAPFVAGPIVWSSPRTVGLFFLGLTIMTETVCGNLLVILSVVYCSYVSKVI